MTKKKQQAGKISDCPEVESFDNAAIAFTEWASKVSLKTDDAEFLYLFCESICRDIQTKVQQRALSAVQ